MALWFITLISFHVCLLLILCLYNANYVMFNKFKVNVTGLRQVLTHNLHLTLEFYI